MEVLSPLSCSSEWESMCYTHLATIGEPILLLKAKKRDWVLDDMFDPQESTLPLDFVR